MKYLSRRKLINLSVISAGLTVAQSIFPNPIDKSTLSIIKSTVKEDVRKSKEWRLKIVKNYWESFYNLLPNPLPFPPDPCSSIRSFNISTGLSAYPTEYAITYLSAYIVTKNKKWRDRAIAQLDYAHSLEENGCLLSAYKTGLHCTDSQRIYMHRDRQARQIYNFYVSYLILKDIKYYQWAVTCAEKMMVFLPRAERKIQDAAGRKYKLSLFCGEFVNIYHEKEYKIFDIDCNQNAEIALAFALLATDTNTNYRDSLRYTDIVLSELLASISLQNITTGAIPTHEGAVTEYDTLYGSYTAFLWVWISRLNPFHILKNSDLDILSRLNIDFKFVTSQLLSAIELAANWLAKDMNLSKGAINYYYCNENCGQLSIIGAVEMNTRLPVYWDRNINTDRFVDRLFLYLANQIEDLPLDASNRWGASFAYYKVMNFPLELLGIG